ncbi:hypothetical protein BDAP_002375 [Binucleata daphniae]
MSDKILLIHEQYGHRKNIGDVVRKKGFSIDDITIKKILNECEQCQMMDKMRMKSAKFIHTELPGDIMGIDMLEITIKERIIVCIEYFTRKLFCKQVSKKK